MGTVSPSQSSPGEEITAAKINTPVNQLAAEINGGLDNDNIASDAGIAGSKLAVDSIPPLKLQGLYAPQGFLQNGKITTSISSNDLVVSIKTLAGGDPSASDPVYVRVGNSVRSITAALSKTLADGTNWFNSGAAEHATQDIDYFVYIGHNATDGVVLGFSRIPYGRVYSDFSATTTNDKYCAISNITTAASTDEYELVGRFNATLSAGAGYTWTIPATSIIINRPIFTTRELTWSPTLVNLSGGTTNIAKYVVSDRGITFRYKYTLAGAGVGSGVTFTLPMTPLADEMPANGYNMIGNGSFLDSGTANYNALVALQSTYAADILAELSSGTYGTPAGLTSGAPHTWATGDVIFVRGSCRIA